MRTLSLFLTRSLTCSPPPSISLFVSICTMKYFIRIEFVYMHKFKYCNKFLELIEYVQQLFSFDFCVFPVKMLKIRLIIISAKQHKTKSHSHASRIHAFWGRCLFRSIFCSGAHNDETCAFAACAHHAKSMYQCTYAKRCV